MKIILLLVILCICGFLGRQFQKQYQLRTRHYAELLEFCAYCKNQISFLNVDKKSIFNAFLSKKETLIKNSVLGKKVGYLNCVEIQEIDSFLNAIGNFAVEGELKNIEYFKENFSLKHDLCEKEEKTKGVLCFKMGWLLGLLLCIVLF